MLSLATCTLFCACAHTYPVRDHRPLVRSLRNENISPPYLAPRSPSAKRILFLVDRGNLGDQTENEFGNFEPIDDPTKFLPSDSVQRLRANSINPLPRYSSSRSSSSLSGESAYVFSRNRSLPCGIGGGILATWEEMSRSYRSHRFVSYIFRPVRLAGVTNSSANFRSKRGSPRFVISCSYRAVLSPGRCGRRTRLSSPP